MAGAHPVSATLRIYPGLGFSECNIPSLFWRVTLGGRAGVVSFPRPALDYLSCLTPCIKSTREEGRHVPLHMGLEHGEINNDAPICHLLLAFIGAAPAAALQQKKKLFVITLSPQGSKLNDLWALSFIHGASPWIPLFEEQDSTCTNCICCQ